MTTSNRQTRVTRKLWGEITFDDWCELLDRQLSSAERESVPGGTVWMVKENSDMTVSHLLWDLATKAGYEEPWEETDYDEALDVVRKHFMWEDHAVIHCEVTSHMASGSWGVGQFVSGGRGYFYRIAEFGVGDDEGEAIPILSAWAPVDDPQVYEAAFLKTYQRHWGCGLPPQLGEWAEGPPKLMTKALTTVLAQKPDMWAKVLDKLKELGRVPSLFVSSHPLPNKRACLRHRCSLRIGSLLQIQKDCASLFRRTRKRS